MSKRPIFFGFSAKIMVASALLLNVTVTPIQAAILNYAPAIDALGQYDGASSANPQPSYTRVNANNAPNQYGFNGPYAGAIDQANRRFFQADQQNNRVLVYNLNPDGTFVDRIPDAVLGQTDFVSNNSWLAQAGLVNPVGLAYDSARGYLFVSQGSGGNRVSVFDVNVITNGEPAINVLGQPDFVTGTGVVSQAGMNDPYAMTYDSANQRLFVVQISANRVTVYDVATITDGENAINVLGQTDFTSFAAATTQAGLNNPRGIVLDEANNRLFIANYGAGRVTVYDVATITDGENAVNVLGQTDFTSGTGATTQAGMNQPRGLAYDSANQRLFVGQVLANRVTVYDVAAITDGEAATGVIGQANFTAGSIATTQTGLNTPFDLTYDGNANRLYVANFSAHRVTAYDVATVTNGEAAIDGLGQYNGASVSDPQPAYTRTTANDAPNRLGFNQPQGLLVDRTNNRLFVADTLNNRVLVYNLDVDGQLLDRIPDAVLGQVDFVANTAAITQAGLNGPSAMAYDTVKNLLYVLNVNRVIIYDVAGITNGENAVNVLGQLNFTANTAGNTQAGMNSPRGIALDQVGQRLFVSQNGNNRVTVYDVATITDGEAATGVLGQFTYTATAASSTASGLSAPRGVAFDPTGNRLFVASSGNHRVTVFDVAAITNGEAAVHIIGQPNYASVGAAVTQSGLSTPTGLAYDDVQDRLYVANLTAHRITVYDVAVINDGQNATYVFGQPDFTNNTFSNSRQGANAATALAIDPLAERLYAGQLGNHRVSVYDTSNAGFNVTESGGSTVISEGAATDTISIVLTAPTLSQVTFDITSNDTAASTTPITVTFTSSTWNIPQTVTVFAPEDANLINESATLTISVAAFTSDDAFDGLPAQTVAVSVIDDDVDTDGDTIVDEIDTDDDNDTILDTIEDAGPNNGDIDSNATPDRLEANVASIPNAVNGDAIGLVLAGNCSAITSFTAALPSAYATDTAYTYPTGFADFTASCLAPGDNTTATIMVIASQSASSLTPRKFDPTASSYETVNASFSDILIGSTSAVQAVYVIQDGGVYDTDAAIDGSVADPIGFGIIIPVIPAVPVVSTGGGSAVYGCKDRNAANYNPAATLQNHNSCEYAVAPLPIFPPVMIPDVAVPPAICQVTQLPTKPIKLGAANDPVQVKYLEAYLNASEGLSLPIDGVYSKADMLAVIAWQERYANEILQPWGLTKGTGFVSIYSLKKLASIQNAQCKPTTAAPPAKNTCHSFSTNLVRGNNNAGVLALQKILVAQGYLKATPNGNFGPATQAAVIAFQKAQKIDQTGSVGPLTRKALNTLTTCH